MKRLALTAVLLLASPLSVLAAPASDAQVDRLLEVMHVRENLATMLPQMEAQQVRMIEQLTADKPLPEADQARVQTLIARTHQHLRQVMTWDKMAPMYRRLYRETFSAEEVEAMLGFYGSPSGQAMLTKMPTLMVQVMEATQELLKPAMGDIRRDVEEFARSQAQAQAQAQPQAQAPAK